MTLSLTEMVNISFVRPLNRREAEELLGYVAGNLSGKVTYQTLQQVSLRNRGKGVHIHKTYETLTITGNVIPLHPKTALLYSFISQPSEDLSKISGIRFISTPHYKLEQHRPEVVQLCNDVRTVIAKYFKENS